MCEILKKNIPDFFHLFNRHKFSFDSRIRKHSSSEPQIPSESDDVILNIECRLENLQKWCCLSVGRGWREQEKVGELRNKWKWNEKNRIMMCFGLFYSFPILFFEIWSILGCYSQKTEFCAHFHPFFQYVGLKNGPRMLTTWQPTRLLFLSRMVQFLNRFGDSTFCV